MHVLVTGSRGFIGKNLITCLRETQGFLVSEFNRNDRIDQLESLIKEADAIVHLAGANRPNNILDFELINYKFTATLCNMVRECGKKIPIIFSSSSHVSEDTPYGRSKLMAESCLKDLAEDLGNSIFVYRLPNVFGKWCKPNYNSVVATFCHNIAFGLPIRVDNPDRRLNLVYIDHLILEFISALKSRENGFFIKEVDTQFSITVGSLAKKIERFKNNINNLALNSIGNALTRALYATYLSYLSPSMFSYKILRKSDERGDFVELLKNVNFGQVSFFTVKPKKIRGGHYHHSKSEKFIVISGEGRFDFENIRTKETAIKKVSDKDLRMVYTVPGWAHSITNTGTNDMIVLVWASEVFDESYPDTFSYSLGNENLVFEST